MDCMPQWTISEVARQAGLRASAIRYYEQIGILLPAPLDGPDQDHATLAAKNDATLSM
jgi:hypothetical protein